MGNPFSCRKKKKGQQKVQAAPDPAPAGIHVQGDNHHHHIIGSTINVNNYKHYKPPSSPVHELKKILYSTNTTKGNIKKFALSMVVIPRAERASFIYGYFRVIDKTPFAICSYLRKSSTSNNNGIKQTALFKAVSYINSIAHAADFEQVATRGFDAHCRSLGIYNQYFNVHFLFQPMMTMTHLDFIRAGFALKFENESMYLLKALAVNSRNIHRMNEKEMAEVCESMKWNKRCIKPVATMLAAIASAITFQQNDPSQI